MIRLELPRRTKEPFHVLCLGAHSDDIEIGCAGTILDLIQRRGPLEVQWVVFSGNAVRAKEARASARALLRGARSRIETKQFRDGFFPAQTARLKEEFERLKRRARPDVIFCPWRGDAHQDHRLIAELAWNTFRDHLILEYEIPKYDGDLRSPNVYVPLAVETCRTKVEHILGAFPSQAGNQWFDAETFWSVLRLRGMESNSPSRFGEGFYCTKLTLG